MATALPAAAQTVTSVALTNPGFELPYVDVNKDGGLISGQVANGWSDISAPFNPTI